VNKDFLVFNLEFAEVLIHDFGVSPERIAFWTDCEDKIVFAEGMYEGIKCCKVELNKESIAIMTKNAKDIENKDKFDVVIGNPPYQDPNNPRTPLWQSFVHLSLSIVKQGGYISLIHPSSWRKAEHCIYPKIQQLNLQYLEIHNQQDGQRTFGCGTRYDWYVLKNCDVNSLTHIVDENGNKYKINIKDYPFIPNTNILNISKILANNDNHLTYLISYSAYETRKSWMSKEEKGKFKYPCIHNKVLVFI